MSDESTPSGDSGAPATTQTSEAPKQAPVDTGRAGSDDNLKADLARERKERQAAAARAEELQSQLEKFQEANKSEQEKALEKAAKEATKAAKAEADSAWSSRIIRTEVKAAAVGKFADPADALAFLDLTQFSVDDDGDTDAKAINAALDALLKEKPHLAKNDTAKTVGSADQGARGTGGAVPDMNQRLRDAFGSRR
jgi:hypothetical protein